MGHLKGCLTLFVVILVLGLVVNLLRFTWPVCAPTVVVVIAWVLTTNSKHLAKKAIHDVLGPAAVGLLLVCALLLLFNAMTPPPDVVSHTERALVYADSRAPGVTKLSTVRFSVAIVLLTVIAYFFPRQKSVTRFFLVKEWVGRTTSALSVATTFTFFTNVAIVQPKVPDVYIKIEAIYRNSKEGQVKYVGKYLAAKAVKRALSNLQSPERAYFEYLLEDIAAVPTMDVAGRKILASYTALQLHQDAGLPIGAEGTQTAASPLPHTDALNLLDDQLTKEKIAGRFADEAVKAAQESLNFGNDALKELGWSFVDRLIGEQAMGISRLAKPYVDKITDKYFENYTEPIIRRQAEAVRRFFQHPERGAAAQTLARRETQSAMALMSVDEANQAKSASSQALRSAQKATMDANAGNDDQAQLELGDAERASAQSLTDANFAKAAANSMKDAGQAFLSVSDQTPIAAAAAGAADAANSLRTAAKVEEAIKSANAAAQIVEDARVAKNAAEAAEAAKTLFRAIPK